MCSSLYSQLQPANCDTSGHIFVHAEQMPEPNLTNEEILILLNDSLDFNNYEIAEGEIIYIGYVVNCKGEDFGYRSYNPIDKKLENQIAKILEDKMEFLPGIQWGVKVDVAMNLNLIYRSGHFELKEELKRKRKKK
jgi:hypothetical protein